MSPAITPEWTRFGQRGDVYGIAFIHANFVKHRFSKHAHDYYVLGLIEAGVQTFSHQGVLQRTAPGGIILLNPDEPHTGEAGSQAGFTYRALYPSVALLKGLLLDITGTYDALPYFGAPIVYDVALSRRILELHQLLGAAHYNGMAGETIFMDVMRDLIIRYADAHYQPLSVGTERNAVQRAQAYIEAHYDQNLTLRTLAEQVALSPYHLARTFARQTGMPPHGYLESVRIRHAQRLLLQGIPIAHVALMAGFPHQSHFTNRFRRAIGVTPGEYQKNRKITQDVR